MASIIIGIDPGLHGGLAVFSEGELCGAYPMPIRRTENKEKSIITKNDEIVKKKSFSNDLDIDALLCFFQKLRPNRISVYIERVGAMPQQGVTSCFNFGFGTGILHAASTFYADSIVKVEPNTWKRVMHCTADKDTSREQASKLFPDYADCFTKKSDPYAGKAEAALIGWYGLTHDRRHENGQKN